MRRAPPWPLPCPRDPALARAAASYPEMAQPVFPVNPPRRTWPWQSRATRPPRAVRDRLPPLRPRPRPCGENVRYEERRDGDGGSNAQRLEIPLPTHRSPRPARRWWVTAGIATQRTLLLSLRHARNALVPDGTPTDAGLVLRGPFYSSTTDHKHEHPAESHRPPTRRSGADETGLCRPPWTQWTAVRNGQPAVKRSCHLTEPLGIWASDLHLSSERVTGIEPALSAWESVPSGPVAWPDLRVGLSASDRKRPLVTGVNGPLMARQS